jgi:hypothetical protein
MLSMEEEVPCDTSPTASSGASSEHTAFAPVTSMSGSDASSRLEDAVFSMDEDGAGNRSPPRARSPDARLLPPSRFAAEAGATIVAKPASAAPVTPATTKALSVSFVSPLAAAAGDSLPASFDSLALHDSPDGDAMSLAAPSSLAASSAFAGPASYAPSAGTAGGSRGSASSGRRTGRKCSRRKLAIGSRLLKLTTQNYPPLVEARAAGAPSMSALAVFRDLSEEQWEALMASVRSQVARKLRDGAWKQAAASKGPPMMSCPRF